MSDRLRPAYLDNHATTPVDPRVVAAMACCWTEEYGNPGSVSHAMGHRAAELVDEARSEVAAALGAQTSEVVFTSGATESDNLALFGVAQRRPEPGHLISVLTEHKAVLDPLQTLARRSWEVTLLPVAAWDAPVPGLLDPQQVADALRPETRLVSVMLANNEIGVLQPLGEIARIRHERGVPVHCDATQALGRLLLDGPESPLREVDLISFSAHKLYGPKGVGGLIVRRAPLRVRLTPQIVGGGQEGGRRSGTLNVPGIIGLAAAVRLARQSLSEEAPRIRRLRDQLAAGLQAHIEGVQLNGPPLTPESRLDGNLNCSFTGVDGEALMMSVPEIAVSSGSACTSANPEPSHVLRALGLSEDLTRASLRFGVGRFNTEQEIELAIDVVARAVQRLRRLG